MFVLFLLRVPVPPPSFLDASSSAYALNIAILQVSALASSFQKVFLGSIISAVALDVIVVRDVCLQSLSVILTVWLWTYYFASATLLSLSVKQGNDSHQPHKIVGRAGFG